MVILTKHQKTTLTQGDDDAAEMAAEINDMLQNKGISGHNIFNDIHEQTGISGTEWLDLVARGNGKLKEVG